MEPFFLSLFLILIFLISLSLFSFSSIFKSKSSTEQNSTDEKLHELPPGRTGWPFIGEGIEYLSLAKKGCIENFISTRKNKHNPMLFKTSLLGETVAVLCSAEGNKLLFSSENKLVKSWRPRNFGKIFDNSDKTSTIEETMRMRSLSIVIKESNSLQKYVEIIDQVAKDHLEKYWEGKEEVKVYFLARKFTFTLACKLMLNIEDPEVVEELQKLFDHIAKGFFSLPINIPGTTLNRAIRASREIRKKFLGMIKQRKIEIMEKTVLDYEANDIVSKLLLEKSKDGEGLNESEIANMILGLLVAAHDNTSVTVVSTVKYLAELPETYDKFHGEQKEIANSKGPEELLNFRDINEMKYSWNVICEVLRLQPPVIGTFREAITGFNYDGFLIPKGWKLHWFAYATHKNPKYFPEPEKFDPSRFEGNRLVPFTYVPFGEGPHKCPGRAFARLQILVFMHNLVNKFRWEKVFPDEQLIRDPLLVPTKGLPIRLYPQKP
ncbi:beta-amyrin 28-monooxygenase-like [Mangifera indica]|uniref:beta-amyrin 28-monooxygenase-like n=1 Tax=Mangifera indica TaxID=29780 RepID=UPI001CFA7FE0|nr:beta-amyrin 28-monooxygenase-like [Mangifera indica]